MTTTGYRAVTADEGRADLGHTGTQPTPLSEAVSGVVDTPQFQLDQRQSTVTWSTVGHQPPLQAGSCSANISRT